MILEKKIHYAFDFSVHTVLPRYVGAKVVDCQAFVGLGDSGKIKLFDEEGCPLDLQVDCVLLKFSVLYN